jgi:hypothetical protein
MLLCALSASSWQQWDKLAKRLAGNLAWEYHVMNGIHQDQCQSDKAVGLWGRQVFKIIPHCV